MGNQDQLTPGDQIEKSGFSESIKRGVFRHYKKGICHPREFS